MSCTLTSTFVCSEVHHLVGPYSINIYNSSSFVDDPRAMKSHVSSMMARQANDEVLEAATFKTTSIANDSLLTRRFCVPPPQHFSSPFKVLLAARQAGVPLRGSYVAKTKMASNTDKNSSPVSPLRPEESATTREEMNFDDEQESGTISPQGHETPTKLPAKAPSPRPRVSFQEGHEEIPPTKPPRPLSPMVQAENTLIEAFPSIDTKVVKAVLNASGGRVEPAFNALLGMSDPDFQPEEQAPAQPPRPAARQPMSQLEADEAYARQLAEQFNVGGQRNRYNQREPGQRRPNQQHGAYDSDDERNERSFFDDELPEIGRNIQQGFMETQKRVNSWINNFKKKIDGEDEDEDLYGASASNTRQNTGVSGRQNFGPSQSEQMYGIRKSAEQQRRSTDAQRYDADPRELDAGEFERLEMRDDEARKLKSCLLRES